MVFDCRDEVIASGARDGSVILYNMATGQGCGALHTTSGCLRRRRDDAEVRAPSPPLTYDHHSNFTIILSNLFCYSTPLRLPVPSNCVLKS